MTFELKLKETQQNLPEDQNYKRHRPKGTNYFRKILQLLLAILLLY